jgi:hypothetical protein|tara:strand:- start:923 stop:1153 length:231 start_codon:yes stop_codon:yes gene_type:complete
MKTNISIELTDEQRLILGQKFHNSKAKKLITRKELGRVVRAFIEQIQIQSNIPDEMGIEQFTKAIAKMRWKIETDD